MVEAISIGQETKLKSIAALLNACVIYCPCKIIAKDIDKTEINPNKFKILKPKLL